MNLTPAKIAYYKKAFVAALGLIATVLGTTFPEDHRVQLIVGALGTVVTALSVAQAENGPAPEPAP